MLLRCLQKVWCDTSFMLFHLCFCLYEPAKNRNHNSVPKRYTGMEWIICSTWKGERFCVYPFISSCNTLSLRQHCTYLTIDVFLQKAPQSMAVHWLNYIYISFCVNMCELCYKSKRNEITVPQCNPYHDPHVVLCAVKQVSWAASLC